MSQAPLIVRFREFRQYDINWDADTVQFMATTGKGTYHATIFDDGATSIRKARQRFKEKVVDLMRSNANPCEVNIENE